MAAPVARRVLQQIRERALQLRGIGADQRQVGGDRQREGPGRQRDVVDGGQHHLLDRAPLHARLGRARLQARHVEQVVDQARQPPGLAGDVGHELAVLGGRQRGRAERAGRREDRRQRGAQVVRDGAQQRGLEHVGTAQSARLDHFTLQRLALDRGTEDGFERGDHALLQALEHRRGQPGGDQQRPEAVLGLAQGEGDAALVALESAQLDARRAQPERLGQALGDRRQARRRGSRRATGAAPSRPRDPPPGDAPAPRAHGCGPALPACWRSGRR